MGYQDERIIDGYFGKGTFDDWTEWQRNLQTEKRRYEQIVKPDFSRSDDGLILWVQLADNVRSDLEMAFRYALQNKKIDKTELEKLLDIFELLVAMIEDEIDVFQAIAATGVMKGLLVPIVKMFPIRQLNSELAAYQGEMELLRQNLEMAKQLRIEAILDKTLDIAGLVLEFIPEISLTKKAAFALGALLADADLGLLQQPSGSKIARTTGSTFAEPLVENLGKFGASMTKVAAIGGKINAAYDVMNLSELDEANKLIADIKASLKAQKEFHERIVVIIWDRWKTRLFALENQLKQIERNIRKDRIETIKMRNEINAEISKARYNSPKSWRILP